MGTAGGAYYTYTFLPPEVAFRATRATGSTLVRIPLFWARVVGDRRPANAKDPREYHWNNVQIGYDFDAYVKAAVDAGLDPVVSIFEAPKWAECNGNGLSRATCHPHPPPAYLANDDGSYQPSVTDFADFVTALLRHINAYPAKYRDAMRYFQIWNEPNLRRYWKPMGSTTLDRAAVSRYRRMLNAVAPIMHGTRFGHRANKIISGGMSPRFTIPPRTFFRTLVSKPVHFDIWSNHPYTGDVDNDAGPTARAPNANWVWLGDLAGMGAEVRRAYDAGQILASSTPQLWVTEFSWDSAPPDAKKCVWRGRLVNGAVPLKLLAHWVSELPFYLWKANVSAFIWHQLKDNPTWWRPSEGGAALHPIYQGGLFFASKHDGKNDGGAKGAMRAFRFPFYAKRTPRDIFVWGRRPYSRRGAVTIEWQHKGGPWKALARINASDGEMRAGGIFRKWIRVSARRDDNLRARTVTRRGTISTIAFTLNEPRDQQFTPWGCTAEPPPPSGRFAGKIGSVLRVFATAAPFPGNAREAPSAVDQYTEGLPAATRGGPATSVDADATAVSSNGSEKHLIALLVGLVAISGALVALAVVRHRSPTA